MACSRSVRLKRRARAVRCNPRGGVGVVVARGYPQGLVAAVAVVGWWGMAWGQGCSRGSRTRRGVVGLVVAVLLLTGCTGQQEPEPSNGPDGQVTTPVSGG